MRCARHELGVRTLVFAVDMPVPGVRYRDAQDYIGWLGAISIPRSALRPQNPVRLGASAGPVRGAWSLVSGSGSLAEPVAMAPITLPGLPERRAQ